MKRNTNKLSRIVGYDGKFNLFLSSADINISPDVFNFNNVRVDMYKNNNTVAINGRIFVANPGHANFRPHVIFNHFQICSNQILGRNKDFISFIGDISNPTKNSMVFDERGIMLCGSRFNYYTVEDNNAA